ILAQHDARPADAVLGVAVAGHLRGRTAAGRPERRGGPRRRSRRAHQRAALRRHAPPRHPPGSGPAAGPRRHWPHLDYLDGAGAALLAAPHTSLVRVPLALLAQRRPPPPLALSRRDGLVGESARRL